MPPPGRGRSAPLRRSSRNRQPVRRADLPVSFAQMVCATTQHTMDASDSDDSSDHPFPFALFTSAVGTREASVEIIKGPVVPTVNNPAANRESVRGLQ